MNYTILQKIKDNWRKAVKGLSIFFAVFLVLTIIFYSPKSSSDPLPNCASLDDTTAADPGVNCLYLDLPICTSTSNAISTVADPDPRVNCADVIDLPLCSDFDSPDDPTKAKELKNCVRKCGDISNDPTKIRGVEYAVHNRDCLRFCSDDPALEDLSSDQYKLLPQSQQCIAARCHQISGGDIGNHNCNKLSCKLLTIEELHDSKFTGDTQNYCDGSDKCYNFAQNKLPYLIPNTMCQLQTCSPQPQPASAKCEDDANKVINQGESFTQDYIRYIIQPKENDGTTVQTPAALSSTDNNAAVKKQMLQSCIPSNQICLPLVKRQYRCEPQTDDNPTTPNANCDTGATCDSDGDGVVDGFCNKTIDCYETPSAAECIVASYDPDDTPLDVDDDSWFYNPAPLTGSDKSVNNDTYKEMSDSLCYNKDNMINNGWGSNKHISIPFLGINYDLYFHSQFQPDKTRSPGYCNASKAGFRGTGYLFLCGNNGNVNAKVSQWTAYNSNISSTTFTNTDSETKVKVCLRFKNAFRPMDTVSNSETCGKRECAISCVFGICKSQLCGDDVCRTLTVKESKATDCIMDNNMFKQKNDGRDCASIIDGTLRVRAVQYSNQVCTFLDAYDHLAYNENLFLHGDETLSDGTCIGPTDSNGKCNGQDSTASPGEITFWRAIMLIKHVINNRDSNPKGYIKKDGKLVKEQECIKIPLRVRTPKLYNLVTKDNAFKLFTPPVFISKSYIEKGSNQSSIPISDSDIFGPTDFNYPQIEVTYGESTTQILSLDINKTGYEAEDQNPNAWADLTTSFNGYTYKTHVLIRKDFNSETSTPTLCLYQTVTDTNGNPQTTKLECVNRTFPEINNNPLATPTRKVIIAAPATNTYDSAQISLKYQGPTATDISSEILLGNKTQSIPECKSNVENYKICAQREECNMLNNEYVTNEINIQNDTPLDGQDMNSMLAMRDYFNNTLIPACNQKFGKVGNNTYSNAYGWFNEICISSGFETKLKDIIAYKVFDEKGNEVPSIRGKCVIDTTLSKNHGANCTDGGKAPDCICQDASNITPSATQVIRKQTTREAGLCVDIPTPQMCPFINYESPAPAEYGDCTTDSCNAARTAALNSGHADFPLAYGGMKNVVGQCIGNWKNAEINGVEIAPTMECTRNADDSVSWKYESLSNPCVRYSCPAISAEPRINSGAIIYVPYSYVNAGEDNDIDQGKTNGYATWGPQASEDTMKTMSAISCLTGFTANGTTNPTRGCSPKGIWQNVDNVCVRKTCPALNDIGSTDADWEVSSNNPLRDGLSNDDKISIWKKWDLYGGASFAQTNASRVVLSSPNYEAAAGSIATGTCNEHLGYFAVGTGPTMKCNSDGQWVDLQNRCTTSCDAIINGGPSDGNASWDKAEVPAGQDYVIVNATSCNAGYKAYPYSAPQDVDGNYINPINPNDPNDPSKRVYVDATPLSAPQRKCENSDIVDGATIIKAAVFKQKAYPACTNKCPGSGTDPRVGVGITKHLLSNGTYAYVEWDDASAGETQVKYSSPYLTPPDSPSQTVANYYDGRPAGTYAVKRTCGADLKWQDPTAQCSANSGVIVNSNATFAGGTSPYYTIDENTVLTGRCSDGYGTKTTPPEYKCASKNDSKLIDQFYYVKSGGGTCVKTCDIPAIGKTYGTGSYYNGGASGTKFAGDTITLACRTDPPYGKITDNISNTSDSSCGRSNSDRSNISPTTVCLSTGQWSSSATNDCTACASCTCSDGNCGSKPYPFIRSTSDQTKVVPWTYADDPGQGDTNDDCFIAGPYERGDTNLCGNSGDSTINVYPGTVISGEYVDIDKTGSNSNSVTYRFRCYDGLFTVEQVNKSGTAEDINYSNYN